MILALLLTLTLQAQTLRTVCSSGCGYSLSQLQTAIDDAAMGDIIQISAQQTVSVGANRITLRNKGACTAQITIRSSAAYQLTPGARPTTPGDASYMAKIYADTGSTAVIGNEQGAECYRLHGLEITAHPNFPMSRALVSFGTETPVLNSVADSQPSQLPSNIVIEQCWIHGHPSTLGGPRRGILAHTRKLELINNVIDDIRIDGNESNAVGGWNTAGPIYFINNRMSSAAITTLFGGALPNIRGLRASGLFFYGNHYYRPWKWRKRTDTVNPSGACMSDANGGEYWNNTANSTYWECVGGTWTSISSGSFPTADYYQKNSFELKNAWRVWVEGNYLENSWQPAAYNQIGALFLFNLVDNDPGQPGLDEKVATVGYVDVRNNYGRRAPWTMSLGYIGTYWLGHNHVTFDNNLFDEIADAPFTTLGVPGQYKGGGGHLWIPATGDAIRITNNTLVSRNPVLSKAAYLFGIAGGSQPTNVQIAGNIIPWNDGGFYNDSSGGNIWTALPMAPANAMADGSAVSRNVVINNQSVIYGSRQHPYVNLSWVGGGPIVTPACAASSFDNTGSGSVTNGDCALPAAYTDVFTSYGTQNYKVKSPYAGWGLAGRDPGADIDPVTWSTSGVSSDGATLPTYLRFQVRQVRPGQTWVIYRYTAPTTAACTTTMSTKPDLSSPVINALTDGGGDLDRYQTSVNGLSVDTRYYWRITCAGGVYREGIVTTNP